MIDDSCAVYTIVLGPSRIRRNVLISGVVLLIAFVMTLVPGAFDRPLTRLVESFANRSVLFDHLIVGFDRYFTFSGVVLMSLVWNCWFSNIDLESRARLLVGTLASFGAGVISRAFQHALSTHPRPYHDPALGIAAHFPPGSNDWNSFPSDHATVFAGLVVVIFIARSRFAVVAIVWTIIEESFRTYIGAHYPSDLIGGAALGALVVWAAQASWPVLLGQKVLRWEQSSPSLFYMSAFFLSYQIATLFSDVRSTFSWQMIVPLFFTQGELPHI